MESPPAISPRPSPIQNIKNLYLIAASVFITIVLVSQESDAPLWVLVILLLTHIGLIVKRDAINTLLEIISSAFSHSTASQASVQPALQSTTLPKQSGTLLNSLSGEQDAFEHRNSNLSETSSFNTQDAQKVTFLTRKYSTSSSIAASNNNFTSLKDFVEHDARRFMKEAIEPAQNSFMTISRKHINLDDDRAHPGMVIERTSLFDSRTHAIITAEFRELQKNFQRQMENSDKTNFDKYCRGISQLRIIMGNKIRDIYKEHLDNLNNIDFLLKSFRLSLSEVQHLRQIYGVSSHLSLGVPAGSKLININGVIQEMRCLENYGFINWKWEDETRSSKRQQSSLFANPSLNTQMHSSTRPQQSMGVLRTPEMKHKILQELLKLVEDRKRLDLYVPLELAGNSSWQMRMTLFRRLYTIGCEMNTSLQQNVLETEPEIKDIHDAKILYRFVEKVINTIAKDNEALKLRCQPQFRLSQLLKSNCCLIDEKDSGLVHLNYYAGNIQYMYSCEPGDVNVLSMLYFFLLNLKESFGSLQNLDRAVRELIMQVHSN